MSENYRISVSPIDQRKALISHESELSQRSQRFYEYRGDREDLKVIRLPIQIPIYRVANYRTYLPQKRWIKEKSTAKNFFASGEENESVQKIQHGFLWNLAQTEKESISSIVDTLKSEKQRYPILISSSGVVVNGNRRLAAMRELMITSDELLESFFYIDCMVLPQEATEDDMKEIEVQLQMTPETRLPYDWISECIAISDLHERGRSFDAIGKLMRLEPPRVKDKLQMLNEINVYLEEWKGTVGDYESMNDSEEIISQITKKVTKKGGTQQEIARRLGWILLDQRGKEGRIYELRDVTGSLAPLVASKIQEVYPEANSIEQNNDEDNLILELPGIESMPTDQGLLSFLESARDDDELQQEIVDICRVVVEAQKTQRLGNAALRSVREAHTKLVEADITTADPTTIDAIRKQLESIEQRVAYLKNQIDRLG